jgi:hypothetical protein
VLTSDFELEDQQGFLIVNGSQPDACDRVCRWRAHCRKMRRHSVCAMIDGDEFHLEIRWPNWWPLAPELSTFTSLPGASAHNTDCRASKILISELPLAELDSLLDQVSWLMETYRSEELREARKVMRLGFPENPDDYSGSRVSVECEMEMKWDDDGQPELSIPLKLPDIDYAILSAGLEQVFGALPGPIPLADVAASNDLLFGAPISKVSPRYSGAVEQRSSWDESWRRCLGPYQWEDRFPNSRIQLSSGEESLYATRPALDDQSQLAVFWTFGRRLTEDFRGLVYLTLEDSAWKVVETSYDEDWELPPIDKTEEPTWGSRKFPIDPTWRLIHLDFPQQEAVLFTQEDLESSTALYQALAEGTAASEKLDLSILPTFHGPDLTVRQLLESAQTYQEVYWDFEASAESRLLKSMGISVLDMSSAQASCWKLLAHLGDRFKCLRATRFWTIPTERPTDPYSRSICEFLERVFCRAGCSHLHLKCWDEMWYCFQETGQTIARRFDCGRLFERSGTIWFNPQSFRGGQDSIFDGLAGLRTFADPDNLWTKRLWRAAVIEAASLSQE